MGARGGVEMPEADMAACHAHLAKHYEQFDKEPPMMKLVELADLSRALLLPGALKEGRVLSSRNLERLKGALGVLQEILLAAEPLEDEKLLALTEYTMQRLRVAEREAYLITQ